MNKVLTILAMFFIWLPNESANAGMDMPIPSDTIRVGGASKDSTDVRIMDGWNSLTKPQGLLIKSVEVEITFHKDFDRNFVTLYVKSNKTGHGAFITIRGDNKNNLLIVVKSQGLVQGPRNLDLVKLIIAETFRVVAMKSEEYQLLHLGESLVDEMDFKDRTSNLKWIPHSGAFRSPHRP